MLPDYPSTVEWGTTAPLTLIKEEPERLPGPQSFAEEGVACEARIHKVGPKQEQGGTREQLALGTLCPSRTGIAGLPHHPSSAPNDTDLGFLR
jgi:hypothetical protein